MYCTSKRMTDRLVDEVFPLFSCLIILADNSILGTAIDLRGANRAFPITNEQLAFPWSSASLRYVTAPYPTCEASEKL